MKIIYGYSNCSDDRYKKIVSENNIAVLQPDQKYHGLLIKGLADNDIDVYCISGLPINREVTKRLFINEEDEIEGRIKYHYIRSINLPILRHIMIFMESLLFCLRQNSNDTYALCDCLNISNVLGILIGCHIRGIKVCLIVTDIPDMLSKRGFIRYIRNRLLNKADSYIYLTKQMNERLNKYNKPYLVLEGHVDSKIDITDTYKYELDYKKVILYAGSISKLYGINNLVEAYIKADIKNSELRIYGDGDYREELIEICNKYKNIKYMGITNNENIVLEEKKASLLVNPRPSGPEYTKYSFPSKT